MNRLCFVLFSVCSVAAASCVVNKDLGPAADGSDGPASSANATDPGGSETDGTGQIPASTGTNRSTGAAGSTGPAGTAATTCRDALACTEACAQALEEPPLSTDALFQCLLDCEGDDAQEALDLFRLLDCATAECISLGPCQALDEPTGSEGSTSASETGDSTSAGADPDDGACVDCLLVVLGSDAEPEAACVEALTACD